MAAPPEDNQGQNPQSAPGFAPQYQQGGQSGSFVPPSTQEISPTTPPVPIQQQTDFSPQPVVPTPQGFGTSVPPQAPAPPSESGKRKLPLKKIGLFAGLAILVLAIILGAIFAVQKLMGGTKETAGASLVWWGLWEDEATVKPVIAEYEAAHPGVTIKYIKQSPQDYRQRLTSALAKGPGSGAPDIFRFHNSWVPMFKNELSAFPSSVIDPKKFSEDFYPVAASDLTRGGSVVGVPLMTDGLALYINEEIFEKKNVQAPTTWEDLRELAVALTEKDSNGKIGQAGVALGTVGNVDHWQDIVSLMFLQNNADLANPGDKRAEDALLFYTVFATTDKVWDETLPPSTLAFSSGKLAMYFAPSWRVFEIKQKNPSLRFKVVPVPQLPKSSDQDRDVTWASYWAEGVWERSPGKTTAQDFLKFLSQKESLEKIYTNAASVRLFGEPPARRDMASSRLSDPYVGPYLKQAETAKSWYLASRTMDGENTGINSRISKYYEDAINSVREGKAIAGVLSTLSQGVKQVLGEYGVK